MHNLTDLTANVISRGSDHRQSRIQEIGRWDRLNREEANRPPLVPLENVKLTLNVEASSSQIYLTVVTLCITKLKCSENLINF